MILWFSKSKNFLNSKTFVLFKWTSILIKCWLLQKVIIDWTNELGGLDPRFVKSLLHKLMKYEDSAIILYWKDKQTSENITTYPSMWQLSLMSPSKGEPQLTMRLLSYHVFVDLQGSGDFWRVLVRQPINISCFGWDALGMWM